MESVKTSSSVTKDHIASLFEEAVHLTSSVPERAVAAVGPGIAAGPSIQRIFKAQASLKALILDKVQDSVRVAAARGQTFAEVLEFHGNEQYTLDGDGGRTESFPYLFLLKGPTLREQRERLVAEGFKPLLEELRQEVKPFELTHSWVSGTQQNKLVVSWKPVA